MSDMKFMMFILIYNIMLNKDILIQYGTFHFEIVSPKKNYQLLELIITLFAFIKK